MATGELPSQAFISASEAAVNNARAMIRIDRVDVDTRNFANCNVEIFFRE